MLVYIDDRGDEELESHHEYAYVYEYDYGLDYGHEEDSKKESGECEISYEISNDYYLVP